MSGHSCCGVYPGHHGGCPNAILIASPAPWAPTASAPDAGGDLRDRLADALAYKPGSSAYDYADRVLPVVWEYAVECQRAETERFAMIAGAADGLAEDARRDPGMYPNAAEGFEWAAERIRRVVAEVEE